MNNVLKTLSYILVGLFVILFIWSNVELAKHHSYVAVIVDIIAILSAISATYYYFWKRRQKKEITTNQYSHSEFFKPTAIHDEFQDQDTFNNDNLVENKPININKVTRLNLKQSLSNTYDSQNTDIA